MEHIKGAASFAKNIIVLQAIADADIPPGAAELATQLKLPRPTIYRLLSALEAEGFIEQGEQKKWRLGSRLVQMASRVWNNSDIRTTARPFLEQLRDQTGETVHLAVRNGLELMYIDKVESHESVRMTSTIGARVPLHSTSVGKAYLASMSPKSRDEILEQINYQKVTKFTVCSRQELEQQLSKYQNKAYAAEREENELQVACFGAVIKNMNDRVVGAVSISIPLYRMADDHKQYTDHLVSICEKISANLAPF